MRALISRRGRAEHQAAADVVRYRTRVGDLVEVADLAIALDTIGASEAARHFRRVAAALRDEHTDVRGGHVALSRRLGDPYCVFDPIGLSGRRWNLPRWVVDGGQVLLLVEDVVAVGLALRRADRRGGGRGHRRERAAVARFVRALGQGEGLVVALPCLPVDQPLS